MAPPRSAAPAGRSRHRCAGSRRGARRLPPAAAFLLPLLLLAACGGKGPSDASPPGAPPASTPAPAAAAPPASPGAEPFTAVPPPVGGGDAPRVTALRIVPDPSRPSGGLGVEAQGISPRGKAVGFDYAWTRNGEEAGTGRFLPVPAKRGDRLRVTVRPFDADGYGAAVSLDREVANAPPSVGSPVDVAFDGSVWSARIPASDGDGDPLAFRLKEGPQGMAVEADGRVRWTVPEGYGGTASATVTVTDGAGGETEGTFRVTVRNG